MHVVENGFKGLHFQIFALLNKHKFEDSDRKVKNPRWRQPGEQRSWEKTQRRASEDAWTDPQTLSKFSRTGETLDWDEETGRPLLAFTSCLKPK